MSDLYLAELTAYDPALPGTRVLRYSTGLGFVTRPSETPADTFYDPKILQPVLIRRDLFTDGATQGRSRVGYGDLTLINDDGALDGLLDYSFDGRQIVIRKGVDGAAYPSGFSTLLVGTMEQPEVNLSTVTVKVRDRQYELDVPLQATKYAGTNSLPNGLEGVAADLKGKPKPICYGTVTNIAPPCVNTARLIFQVNDGPIASVDAIYDQGIALTAGSDYTDQTDMETNAPAASHYRVWPAGGCFRLGSSPTGIVTADVTEGANAAARTTAQIFTRILTRAGKNPGDWSVSDVTALDTANSAVLGVWVADEATASAILDQVAGSVGAWWGVDRSGVFRIQQLMAPSGTPVASFTANDLLRPLDRLVTNDPGSGIPVYRVIVRYGCNYTVQATDLAGGVSDARRAVLAAEWREASYTDAAVQTAHLLATQTDEDSLLTVESDALAEAQRRQVLRGVRRDRFELLVTLDDGNNAIDLGDVIELTHGRYGLSSGQLFRVLGLEPNARDGVVSLTAWG